MATSPLPVWCLTRMVTSTAQRSPVETVQHVGLVVVARFSSSSHKSHNWAGEIRFEDKVMQIATRLTSERQFSRIIAILVLWLSVSSVLADAQSGGQGQNAVYNSTSGIVGSSAFIDASMFAGNLTNPNFCSVVNYVLVHVVQPTYPNGAVIDTRALPSSNPPTSMTCSASPWDGITNPPPSTILLPATGGTTPSPIVIPTTWVLPSNTHLIGEGDGTPTASSAPGTTIRASGALTTGAMIQFGSSTVCPSSVCTGISVERCFPMLL